jgi:deazaflavin-dependent oxidoreductase (nitroreductase family)
MSSFTERVIEEFRANAGYVTTGGFGDELVLLHSMGAKSGEERVTPLLGIEDGDSWLVAASAAGSERHPAWYYNLLANPDTVIETGTATVAVRATELDGAAHDAAWATFIARGTAFAAYQERAGDRTIPVIRLSPR